MNAETVRKRVCDEIVEETFNVHDLESIASLIEEIRIRLLFGGLDDAGIAPLADQYVLQAYTFLEQAAVSFRIAALEQMRG